MTHLCTSELSLSAPTVGRCRLCGQTSRGTCDAFFRYAEFICRQCGHAWSATLTEEERWDLLHQRKPW
jgi:hypothetical protein